VTAAGRYTGRSGEAWVVRPSPRALERKAVWDARAGASGRGRAVRASANSTGVGASIWQTPGGVQSELERINTDFVVFGREFEGFLKSNVPTKGSLQPLVDLFHNVWTPLLQGWQAFFERNRGWWDNFWWNHAPDAETYADQLVEVRARAKQLGMDVSSPTPTHFAPSLLLDPRHNVFDSLGDGAQHALTDLWGVVKVALYAALAISGGYVLLTVAKTAKTREVPR
jgi:hypothetical protein